MEGKENLLTFLLEDYATVKQILNSNGKPETKAQQLDNNTWLMPANSWVAVDTLNVAGSPIKMLFHATSQGIIGYLGDGESPTDAPVQPKAVPDKVWNAFLQATPKETRKRWLF